ncbi:MAG: two-component system response regulator CreB [Gammaproteobacteria bacterium]
MPSILLIEDEAAIADAVGYALETEGLECRWCQLGREGLDALAGGGYALVILDVGLPDISGFEVCKTIRRSSEVPIIFLTARAEEVDRVVGLEIGGDDYVSKPFSPRELVARVKVILRRVAPREPAGRGDSAFGIDVAKAQIRYHGQFLELTQYEYLILKLLLQQPQRVFSRAQIMDRVWQAPETSLERVVDTHIKSLRAKLRAVNDDMEPIKTHRGLGYSIRLAPS